MLLECSFYLNFYANTHIEGPAFDLLNVQSECKLSCRQTKRVKKLLEKYSTEEVDLKAAQKEALHQGGVKLVILHGCIGQECGHVYGPGDNRAVCPQCGESRYFANSTKPKEMVYHFPIRERLEALLKLKTFRHLLEVSFFLYMHTYISSIHLLFIFSRFWQYERVRKRNPDGIISDVFDTPMWKKKMGPWQLDRIGLLFCIDAIPAFKSKNGVSLMPAEFQILSLPPKLRTDTDFMLLTLLIPSKLKESSQKKYFDYIVDAELNYLATTGLRRPSGRMTKAKVFGITLDLPGRDKFLWLRGYASEQGCPDCLVKYKSMWKMMYVGTRQLLPANSPLRNKTCGEYEFHEEERRPAPPARTTRLMHECLQARARFHCTPVPVPPLNHTCTL